MKNNLIILTVIVAIAITSCRKQPTATITTDKTTIEVGGAVKFTSTSVDAEHVKWTFPDGQTSDANEVTMTFNTSGSKTVKLVAYSKKDKKSDEASVTITVDDINKKFVGNWSVTENCSVNGPWGPYTMTITASGTNGISMANFGDWGATLTATVSGSSFTIPLQTYYDGSGDHDFNGSGSISGNTLTYTYIDDYIDDVDPLDDYTDNCSCTGTKQIAHNPNIRVGGKKVRTVTAIKIN